MSLEFSFAFDDDEARDDLITEARKTIKASNKPLGLGMASSASPAQIAAENLLVELQNDVAEFSAAQPHLQALTLELFAQQNVIATPKAEDLFKSHRLYWLRVPYLLQAKADHRYERVELVIELNPGAAAPERPRIEAALPGSEFSNLAEATVEFTLGIDESLHFPTKVGSPPLPSTPVSDPADPEPATPPIATAGGSAGGQQEGKIKFVAGPFHYRVRKAVIERSNLGTEKMFWRISSEDKLEDPPELVVVIAVPNATTKLEISAALQAYTSPAVLQMSVGNFFKFLSTRLKNFFVSGAPKRDVQVWDLSSSL